MNSQEIYEVVNYALDAANDNGYLNHFVFTKALNVATAMVVVPDEVSIQEGENILSVYDRLSEDGVIAKVVSAVDMCELYDIAYAEFKSYQAYLVSISGSMNKFMDVLNERFASGIKELTSRINSDDIAQVQAIAENWGLNEVATPA